MSTGLSDSELGPLVVSPKKAAIMLDCGLTRVYQLIDDSVLVSFLDGHSRKITVESIRQHIADRLKASSEKLHGKIAAATESSLATRRGRQMANAPTRGAGGSP
jgi:hypothetical protein